jgi:FixJ family two-component response regulator
MGRYGPFIAVVDDESAVRSMLGRLLRLANYQVSAFSSGGEFLASLNDHSPACAIVDINMPELSGLEVQSRMRAAHIRVPVVLITAVQDPAFEQSAADVGAVTLLRKPFSSDELLRAVDVALASDISRRKPT